MNKSLTTYTPRVRPTEYDSLEPDVGAQTMTVTETNAVRVKNIFAFNRVQVEERGNAGLPVFEQPETVSYADGPETIPEPPPFPARWAAWVSGTGIRVGRFSYVTPSSTLGGLSSLYPSTRPARLTLGFNNAGLLSIAIHRSQTTVELKRYLDADGNTATHSWPGRSPALFNTSILHFGGEQGHPDGLVCFYLNRSTPEKLFARFESENYEIEHLLIPSLRVDLERLIAAEAVDGRLALYALDDQGRDVSLYHSAPYYGEIGPEPLHYAVAFHRGAMVNSVAPSGTIFEKTKISLAFTRGKIGEGVASVEALPVEETNLSIAFTGGEIV